MQPPPPYSSCVFSDAINGVQMAVHQCSRHGIAKLLQMEEELYSQKLLQEDVPGGFALLQLEAALLHMAAVPNLCRGIVYWFPVQISATEYIVRYGT